MCWAALQLRLHPWGGAAARVPHYAGDVPAGREDDALMWDGDDDPTLDAGPSAGRAAADPAGLPAGYTAVGKGSEVVVGAGSSATASEIHESDDTSVVPGSMGNVELISLGVLGGFAVLFSVGWLIGGLRLQGTAEFLVAPLAYQVSLWLAVLAPVVWFATVLILTRGARLWVRFAWLIGGVVLLVPWPFLMLGAIGR